MLFSLPISIFNFLIKRVFTRPQKFFEVLFGEGLDVFNRKLMLQFEDYLSFYSPEKAIFFLSALEKVPFLRKYASFGLMRHLIRKRLFEKAFLKWEDTYSKVETDFLFWRRDALLYDFCIEVFRLEQIGVLQKGSIFKIIQSIKVAPQEEDRIEAYRLELEFGEINSLSRVFSNRLLTLAGMTFAEEVGQVLWEEKPVGLYHFQEPRCLNLNFERPFRQTPIPPRVVSKIEDVKIIPGFQILKDDQLVIYERAANPSFDFVAGFYPYIRAAKKNSDKVSIHFPYQEKLFFQEAILLGGRCSSNFFHYLIEYLPKVLLFEKTGVLGRGLPILNYFNLASPLKEATLRMLPEKDRNCLKYISPSTLVEAGCLTVASPPTFMPDSFQYEYWQGAGLDTVLLSEFRERILQGLKIDNSSFKEKVFYLSRSKYGSRQIINEIEMEKRLEKLGVIIIKPEYLSFEAQLLLFQTAKSIIAPTGASMANALFAREGLKILNILAKENSGFSIMSNLAKISGADYYLYCGEIINKRENYFSEARYRFSEFKVDVDDFIVQVEQKFL